MVCIAAAMASAGLSELPAADLNGLKALLWTDGEGGPLNHALEAGIEEFTEAYPDAGAVALEWVSPESAEARLDLLMAAGDPPDVFMTDTVNLPRRVAVGQVEPLHIALDGKPGLQSRLPRPLLDLLSAGGKTYAVPITQAAAIFYYNTGMFAARGLAIPTTYTELKRAIRVFSDNGVTPIAFANKEGWEGVLLWQLVHERLAGDDGLQDALSGRPPLSSSSFLESGAVLSELVGLRAFPAGFAELTNDQAIRLFRDGKAAMLISRDRLYASLDFSASSVKKKVGLAPFPLFEGGAGNIGSWIGKPEFNLAISSASRRKDTAISFITTYLGVDLQEHFAAHVFLPAALPGLAPDKLVPLQKNALDLLHTASKFLVPLHEVLDGDQLTHFADAIRSILLGASRNEPQPRDTEAPSFGWTKS